MVASKDREEPVAFMPTHLWKGKEERKGPEAHLPWVEKYRPTSMEDVVSHQEIIHILNRFMDEHTLPHLLFYGPPGTGKTSLILACARKLYGSHSSSMVLELNASDERGIDVVREHIREFASTQRIFQHGFKLIILDEADAMTHAAQAALRRIMEKYSRTTRFCMICNYAGRIIPALQSRCTRFRFAPLSEDQMKDRLMWISQQEHVQLTRDGMEALLRLSNGDMRKALNILQSTSAAFENVVNVDNVYQCTGHPHPHELEKALHMMLGQSFSDAFRHVSEWKTIKGLALQDILRDIHACLRTISLSVPIRIYLLQKLAEIEYNLASGCHEKIQLGAMVAAFRIGADGTTRLAPLYPSEKENP